MTNLKPGDKVSFINEKRDGVVVRVLNSLTVIVEIEDGFEIPVQAKELICTKPAAERTSPAVVQTSQISETERPDVTQSHNKTKEPSSELIDEETDDNAGVISLKSPRENEESLFFAFVREQGFQEQGLSLYFANASPYDVLFSVFTAEGKLLKGMYYDAVAPFTAVFLKKVRYDLLETVKMLHVQCLFYNSDAHELRQPLSKVVHVAVTKLFADNAFKEQPQMDTNAFVVNVYTNVKPPQWQDEEFDDKLINPVPLRNIKDMSKGNSNVLPLDKKHITAPFIAEVDLHIQHLSDLPAILSNHEKFNIQLQYFARCLDAAIVHKFKKITFIHGVGQGRLKQEIHRVISDSYPGIKIQDAPFNKYGQGATEVLIPFNLVV